MDLQEDFYAFEGGGDEGHGDGGEEAGEGDLSDGEGGVAGGGCSGCCVLRGRESADEGFADIETPEGYGDWVDIVLDGVILR